MLYERALKQLPGSYKLWHAYLKLRMAQVSSLSVLDPAVKEVNNCFERSLVFMHKMPRIWLDYCKFLMTQCELTKTRRTFDRALQALPITQHGKLWPLYLQFVKSNDIPETAVRVYRRYLKLQPEEAEDYVAYLLSVQRVDEAAVKLAQLVNDEGFISRAGKSKHQLWTELAELLCRHGPTSSGTTTTSWTLDVDAILREGIARYVDQQGRLWISLAEYYTRCGLFDKARDVFEEAVATVRTIRDFSQVFDAYTQSEERLIQLKMAAADTAEDGELTEDDELELDLRMVRYEDIIERRPLLLNSVALRQNPHNVEEWHKRVKLLQDRGNNAADIVETYSDAVQTVDPKQAVGGKYHSLWVAFARFYEDNGQLEDARLIFEKAVTVDYAKVDDLATVWCEWAEAEIRAGAFQRALALMGRATAVPKKTGALKAKGTSYFDAAESVQARLHKSLRLWSMYADLEESFGSFDSARAVYEKIIELRIVTPQIIINYGLFLEEANYWEESFKAYEKGVALFRWPNVYDIWNTYLSKFLKRYKGGKVERARDLFEQCLEGGCPPKYCKSIYLLYAKFEEDYGLAKHAMKLYERATEAVLPSDRAEVYAIFISKASAMFGITHTRAIFERAIESLPDSDARTMCLKYADLERKLGEIDRARAIYAHASQMCDPRTTESTFWSAWWDFEKKHGNEDTIREMLRIKRTIRNTFNTQVNFMSAQMAVTGAGGSGGGGAENRDPNRAMAELESLAQEMQAAATSSTEAASTSKALESRSTVAFVRSEDNGDNSAAGGAEGASSTAVVNPDEINLDEDEEEEESCEEEEEGEEDEEAPKAKKTKINGKLEEEIFVSVVSKFELLFLPDIQQKSVPRQVFGSLQMDSDEDD